jgi:hypothetical protein
LRSENGYSALKVSTANLRALGYEYNLSQPAISLWNETGHVDT